jgi:NAD(P)H-dependent flavin oxidoreductase YrpB (nitropropane dioxygenase family)
MREQMEPPMRLRTRLTERFDIEHPIISAALGMITGGRLAAAVFRTIHHPETMP